MTAVIPTPVGTRSLSPTEANALGGLAEGLLGQLRQRGYAAIEVPAFDDMELFERIYGREIRQRLLTFTTDREYALRPDLTASVCRALASRLRQRSMPGPFRIAAAGPAWRHERVRPLRMRQFYQVGVERIGDPVYARHEGDLEIIGAALALIDHEGVVPAVLRVGHAGLREALLGALPTNEAGRRAVGVLLDLISRVRDRFTPASGPGFRLDRVTGHRHPVDPASHEDAAHIYAVARKIANRYASTPTTSPEADNPELLLGDLTGQLKEIARGHSLGALAEPLLALTASCGSVDALRELAAPLLPVEGAFTEALGHLEALEVPSGVHLRFSLAFSRSIGYYTGVIFEIDAPVLGPDAGQIVGGGRYDRVMADLGAGDLPAAGFALGLERLEAAIRRLHGDAAVDGRFSPPPILHLARGADASAEDVDSAVQALRRRGIAAAPIPTVIPDLAEAPVPNGLPGSPWGEPVVTVIATADGLLMVDPSAEAPRPVDVATLTSLFAR